MNAKIIKIDITKTFFTVKTDKPFYGKLNEEVNLSKKRIKRNTEQNSFYWSYLTWCIEFGLKELGHFAVEALHEDIKSWIKDKYNKTYSNDFSTSDLSVLEFANYFDLVNNELMIEFFNLNTSGFFKDYDNFKEWQKSNTGNFKTYICETRR